MKLSLESEFPREELSLPDGNKIVRLEIVGRAKDCSPEERNRNVFLVDSTGNLIWRVAFHDCPHGDDPFVGIQIGADSAILGLTWDGWRFEINPADGSLKKIGWTKS